jgi:hypothetical protein
MDYFPTNDLYELHKWISRWFFLTIVSVDIWTHSHFLTQSVRPVIDIVNRQVQLRCNLVILQLTYRAALNPLYFQWWQWLSINTHFGSNKPYSIYKIYATSIFRVTDSFRQWITDSIKSETNESVAILRVFCEGDDIDWHLLVCNTETVIYYFLCYFYPQHTVSTRFHGNKTFCTSLNILIKIFFWKKL